MTELSAFKNIGKEIEQKLKSIDISTAEELKGIGSKEAYFRIKLKYPSACLVHLYALEGAISGMEYNQLPENVKQSLKEFNDSFK